MKNNLIDEDFFKLLGKEDRREVKKLKSLTKGDIFVSWDVSNNFRDEVEGILELLKKKKIIIKKIFIVLSYFHMNEEVLGMYIPTTNCIILYERRIKNWNKKKRILQTLFTILHEYGHFIYGEDEKKADEYAHTQLCKLINNNKTYSKIVPCISKGWQLEKKK